MLVTYEVLVKSNKVMVNTRGGHHPLTKMYHVDATSPEKAARKVEKHGKPVRVRKADVTMMYGNFENILDDNVYQNGNPYNSALAMDEMIWQKRNNRRNNMHRDKNNY